MKWTVEYYETSGGKNPVDEFLQSLPKKLRAKAYREIELLEENGPILKEPHVSKVRGKRYKGLYELRTKFGSDITRIFYFLKQDNIFILLSGFLKKDDEIPDRILDIALKYKIDFEKRFNNGKKRYCE